MNNLNHDLVRWTQVYPNIQDCSLQLFHDREKEKKTYSKILPMTRENLKWCVELQKKEPYWVFFSVNPMVKGQRNQSSVTKIQTRIVDIDEWTKESQLDLIWDAPLLPSLVVESVHGFHLYYLAETELTKEQFIEGNQWLRDYYNGDVKVVKDTARVLRLPWFLHYKDKPVMIKFREDLSCQDRYTVEQIIKTFPKKVEGKPEIVIKPIEKKWDCDDSYRYKVNNLDNKTMLWELSGTRWVDWEIIDFARNSDWTQQIKINGVPRSCWIDKNWMIGSSDKGWPTWVQWLEYYKKRKLTKDEWRELSEWLKSNHPELEDKKQEKLDIEKMEKKEVTPLELKAPDFTWGDNNLDDAIWKLSRGQLVILSWETWAGKTTFATFMARKNPKSYYFVLEDSMENIGKRYALKRAWITKKELNNGTRSEEKKAMFDTAYTRFMKQDINYLDIWEKTKIGAIIDAMKQLKEKWYWMFFIDNLGFVIWEWKTEMEQTADVSSQLVSFCLKENVCVVLLHHFKKPWDWIRRRDISSLRGSGKLWDDAFFVANYRREDEGTLLEVLKDRTRWDLEIYRLGYDKWDFYLVESIADWLTPSYQAPF